MDIISSPGRKVRVALIAATGEDTRSYGLPLGIGYLAAYLRRHADRLPCALEVLPTESLSELLDFKPDVVGVSSVTSCFNHALEIATRVKQACGARTLAGGYHITALPHRLPESFDAAVLGEGEETLQELLAATAQEGWASGTLSRVAGIAYHNDGRIAINERRPLLQPLDSLPRPLRTPNPFQPNEATIFTSRGCPYDCIFCASCRHWGKFRSFSAEYVVAEIEEVLAAQPAVDSFYLLDDLFIANRPRLRRMVELLEEKGLVPRLRFRGFVRSNLVNEECCELLLRMNCRSVRFGAESASPRILENLKVGTTTVADHQRCIDLCDRFGIDVGASYMVGNPGETKADLQLTYDFIVRNKNKSKVEGFYLLTPLPGTPLWEDCLQKGLVSEEMDWSRLNLSFENPDFRWDDFIYSNDAMPREEFVESVRNHGLLIRDKLKLELGAGHTPEPGFLHLDIQPGPHIEYVADATHLPFPDGVIARIYTRHNLEHFTFPEAREVLAECLRVLEPGGEIYLILPNMEFHIEQFYTADRRHAQAGFWGWQKTPYDVHKWGYWWETLHNLLAEVGFARIENLTGQPNSRQRSPMHLEVRAYKPCPGENPGPPLDFAYRPSFVIETEDAEKLKTMAAQIVHLEKEIAARDQFIRRVTDSLPYRVYRGLKGLGFGSRKQER